MPAGARLVVMYSAANRDPEVFDGPDDFGPGRENLKEHLAFGKGIHFCIGAPLSRLEMQVAFERLASRLDQLRLTEDNALEYHPSFVLRGLKRLEIEFTRPGSHENVGSSNVTMERVGVVGCGLMGSGIAEVCARAGLDVIVREVDAGAAEAGQRRLSPRSTGVCAPPSSPRTSVTPPSDTSVHHRPRRAGRPAAGRGGGGRGRGLKTEVFAALDKVVESPEAILASNTSSIPMMKLGMATSAPSR